MSESEVSQATQEAPPAPQVAREGVRQIPTLQQPVGQEAASHAHDPALHDCPPGHGGPDPHWHAPVAEQLSAPMTSQARQAAPATPQVCSDRVSQLAPEQQPAGQVPEVQLVHTPPLHVAAPVQALQGVPAVPQAVSRFPARHRFAEQQPDGQDWPSHRQRLPWQRCPETQAGSAPQRHAPCAEQLSALDGSQAVHVDPPVPQVAKERVSQVAPAQHPPRQLVASHTQMPATQRWPPTHGGELPHSQAPVASHRSARTGSHSVQALPRTPHFWAERARQVAPSQHPSGQL